MDGWQMLCVFSFLTCSLHVCHSCPVTNMQSTPWFPCYSCSHDRKSFSASSHAHWRSYVHSGTRLRHHSLSVGGVAHWGDKNNCVGLQPLTLLCLCLFIAEVLYSEAALNLSPSYWHSIINQNNSNHFILITLTLGFCSAVCDLAW